MFLSMSILYFRYDFNNNNNNNNNNIEEWMCDVESEAANLYACAVAVGDQHQTTISVTVANTLWINELSSVTTLPAHPQYQPRSRTTSNYWTDRVYCRVLFVCSGPWQAVLHVVTEVHGRRWPHAGTCDSRARCYSYWSSDGRRPDRLGGGPRPARRLRTSTRSSANPGRRRYSCRRRARPRLRAGPVARRTGRRTLRTCPAGNRQLARDRSPGLGRRPLPC